MSNDLTATNKEYGWKGDGKDGLRSYSYNSSNPAWNYSTEPSNSNVDSDGAYIFSDSSTGQPSARRGNLYNMTAATLGSSLVFTSDDDEGSHAADSICPRGWRLMDFDNLLRAYGMNVLNGATDVEGASRIKEWPLGYLSTGSYSNGYASYRTVDGYWWSGTVYTEGFGYRLASWSSATNTEDDPRGWGFALREVARVRNFRFF